MCIRDRDKVDYVVTDSPILLGLAYTPEDYYPHYFSKFIHEVWNSYDNINIVLERRHETYTQTGRKENYEEAVIKDRMMINLLDSNGNNYRTMSVNETTKDKILEYLIWLQKMT